ncbi:putative extracellular SCP domain protein Pry1 [Aspergillus tubingensis]|uniref:putative extracellular SCP domain protein Pry1 n=1 Tax=Aspergillus tubingensis TaxID=5068 RepID=UPI001579F71B|nr:PR-1-like protein [Aspergillus tubingensis]GFN15680.1 PR-1-like protein [Aspergillus tubingensis]
MLHRTISRILTTTTTIILLSALITLTTAQQQQQPKATVIVTIITTATATATAPQTTTTTTQEPPSYTSPALFQSSILDVSNTYRKAHNASNLIWNTTLTQYALNWAQECKWQHSNGPYGENLAFGYPNVSSAVAAWGDEVQKCNFQEPTGFTEETGHFTQLVWRETREVGCAAVDCGYNTTNTTNDNDNDNGNGKRSEAGGGGGGINGTERPQGWYVVCEYSPRGNIIGGNKKLGDKEFFKINVQPSSTYSGPYNTGSAGNGAQRVECIMGLWWVVLGWWLVLLTFG